MVDTHILVRCRGFLVCLRTGVFKTMGNRNWVFLLAGAAVIFSIQPAFAGFEWRAPATTAAVTATEEKPAAPTPVPLVPVSAEAVTSIVSAPAASGTGSSYEGVESFGKDVNIVIALRQIVPPDYQFSFGPEVDLKQNVSWQGAGQPWPVFLDEVFAPLGLKAYLRDRVVVIAAAPALEKQPQPASSPLPMQTIVSQPATPMPTEPPSQAEIMWDSERVEPLPIHKEQQPVSVAPVMPLQQVEIVSPPPAAQQPPAEIAWESSAPIALSAPVAAPPLEEKFVPAPVAPPPVLSERVSLAPQPSSAPQYTETRSQAPMWVAPEGATLRDVLTNWSAQSGVRLFWSIDYDYKLSRDIQLSGSFETAVQAILDNFTATYPRPVGRLYTGDSRERVLVISSPDLLS